MKRLSAMQLSWISACALFLGMDAIHAQVTPGPGGVPAGPNPIVGMPPAPSQGGSGSRQPLPGERGGAAIGQPVPGQSQPVQPAYPSTGSAFENDPVKDRLDRTNREAADLNRDGLISPEESMRRPPGTPLPK